MLSLPTLVSRMLVGGLKRYRTCFLPILPALTALVIPLQLCILVIRREPSSTTELLSAVLLAIIITVLSLMISYALLPKAVLALRGRPVRHLPLPREPVRRAILATSLLILVISLLLGPTAYALHALAVVALFWASWPRLKVHAAMGEHLFKEATRLWWRSQPREKLTFLIALILVEAGILIFGRAIMVITGGLGGPMAGWTSQLVLASSLLPLHLLSLATLGAALPLGSGLHRLKGKRHGYS